MQSLQADQSLYNRKGVCYIVQLSVFCRSRIYNILVPDAKISIFLEKWAYHISNDFTQSQISQKRKSVIRRKITPSQCHI